MIRFLLRCFMFAGGIALILDIALPTRTELLRVDQHTSYTETERRSTSTGTATLADTSYKIHLAGGVLSPCSVGYTTYEKLKDGDAVEVKSTKLFKNCIRIARGDEVLDSDKHWRLFALIGGGIMIAVALGWLKNDDDDGDGISIRIG